MSFLNLLLESGDNGTYYQSKLSHEQQIILFV